MNQMGMRMMALPVDYESEDYNFYKTLNEDAELIPVGKGAYYDINFKNGDYVNLTGKNSLGNAIVIAILTRFSELGYINLYEGFGCKVHDLIKSNQEELVEYDMELYITETLGNMRRIQEINELKLTKVPEGYKVYFKITSINDEIITGSVGI